MDIKTRLRRLFSPKEEPGSNREIADRKLTPPQGLAQPSAQELFGDDNNDFALAMYGQLRRQSENLFFSPFSIRCALSMTEAGARGDTAAQMREVLRLSPAAESPHSGFAEIIQRLNCGGYGQYEMDVANSLWAQDGSTIQVDFVDRIAQQFDGRIQPVNFRTDATAACREINHWVEEKTRQKIRDLIPSGSLSGDTRLVVANAVYFKGTWVLKFAKEDTREEPFYLEGGGKVQVPLMHQQRDRIRYLKADRYQAVELIYESDDLSMLVLLPDRKDGLADLEKALSAQLFRDCVHQMSIREVKLFLPRFKTLETMEMRAHLTALGMSLAFNRSQADFSGINGYEPPHEESLFLSAVFHKAFVDVYEEGTEAAAATGVTVVSRSALWSSKSPPIPIFRADHPFIFAIRDRKSGTILFLGRMIDPARAR